MSQRADEGSLFDVEYQTRFAAYDPFWSQDWRVLPINRERLISHVPAKIASRARCSQTTSSSPWAAGLAGTEDRCESG
jgi:hypothetical protein